MTWPAADPRRIDRANALRQAASSGQPRVNGIVSVEVQDDGTNIDLTVTLIFPAALSGPSKITPADVLISGGVRRPIIAVTNITASGRVLTMRCARRGDFSTYELRFIRGSAPPPQFDLLLSAVPLGFRLNCDQPFDCEAVAQQDALELPQAAIDYQVRDYEGFRRLMTDRFKMLVPGWKDGGAASPDVALIEMLAHVADRLAYAQDAVATEAYLDTARLRVSAKRHARLVDYRMHDGANARAFVHVGLRTPSPSSGAVIATVNPGARFMTRTNGVSPAGSETPRTQEARALGAQMFEAVLPASLSSAHNRIIIHDFLGGITSLPKGATSMTVADPGRLLTLNIGDFLLIEEVLEPETGNASPDPQRRHVVRLTGIDLAADPIGQLDVGGIPHPLETLVLHWAEQDALTDDMPLARVTSGDVVDGIPAGSIDEPSLVARGNMVLADHGESRGFDELTATIKPRRRSAILPLSDGPVTQARTVNAATSAWAAITPSDPVARPAIAVRQELGGGADPVWTVEDELFRSGNNDQHLVLDVEHGELAMLRTGDGVAGSHPDPHVPLIARYRVGNGPAGNVGAEAIGHVLTDAYDGLDGTLVQGFTGLPSDVAIVRNPLPATGGLAPESIADARVRAPIGFRTQERAVVPEDYVRFLLADRRVTNAKAIEQWTGSWRAIVLLVDLIDSATLDEAIEADFRKQLEHVRLAGHVLEFRTPTLVPLEIGIKVCVAPDAEADAVEERLLRIFSSLRQEDGSLGLFHPDRFTFGSALHLSPLYAAAQGVEGVRHVDILSLKRQAEPGPGTTALDAGGLDFGPYEIPVLANDPNFPDRGVVRFAMEGGR
jgi:hypothetical protein